MQVNKKKVLVDLSALKDLYCGLGQVALTYGNYFRDHYKQNSSNYDLTLLVPDTMFGKFGNEVKYLSSTKRLTRKFQFLLPKFEVWHSIHQLSRFRPRNKSTKIILTIHDLNYLYEREGARKKRKHRQIQNKITRANELICISNFAKNEVEQNMNLGGKECTVIYNHTEALQTKNAIKPMLEIKSPFFFSIGVIQKKKNFHVLLELMKLMPEKELYIAGKELNDPKKNGYAEMIRKKIKDEKINNVTLVGPISQEEKIWFYQHCEAFLFPSLFEGFGLPIIEAMQFGKPVFSSKETSLQEIGNKFAYFWKNFESKHMHEVVNNNLNAFKTNSDLINAELAYANSFTSNKHFELYEKLYETI